MNRRLGLCLTALALVSCRDYRYEPKITSQAGLIPPDQFARYGHDQAEAVAIGREFGRTGRADSAMAYARTLGDVTDVSADTLGYRLTVRFKSGWRTGIAPIDDGKRGPETAGLAKTSAKP
jgi:hypothetical protein